MTRIEFVTTLIEATEVNKVRWAKEHRGESRVGFMTRISGQSSCTFGPFGTLRLIGPINERVLTLDTEAFATGPEVESLYKACNEQHGANYQKYIDNLAQVVKDRLAGKENKAPSIFDSIPMDPPAKKPKPTFLIVCAFLWAWLLALLLQHSASC